MPDGLLKLPAEKFKRVLYLIITYICNKLEF